MTNVNEILRDHVSLTVDCMDRIYLNGYIPNLQVPGQLVNFLTKHRGNVIPSPILLGKIGEQFKQAIQAYAEKYVSRWCILKADNVRTNWHKSTVRSSTRQKEWFSSE